MDKRIAIGILLLAFFLVFAAVIVAGTFSASFADVATNIQDVRAFVFDKAVEHDFKVFSNTENLAETLKVLESDNSAYIIVDNGNDIFWIITEGGGDYEFDLWKRIFKDSSGKFQVVLYDCAGIGNEVDLGDIWSNTSITLADIEKQCAGVYDNNTYPLEDFIKKLADTARKQGWPFSETIEKPPTERLTCGSITNCLVRIDQKFLKIFS